MAAGLQEGVRSATDGAMVHEADFPVEGMHHLEFAVGNGWQAAQFYSNAFGMSVTAYRGPETGERDHASYLLESGSVRFVLTAALRPDSDIARHVAAHSDGVTDIALRVTDATAAYELALERGALPGYMNLVLTKMSLGKWLRRPLLLMARRGTL